LSHLGDPHVGFDAYYDEAVEDMINVGEGTMDIEEVHAIVRGRAHQCPNYTDLEDKMICEVWMSFGQDLISGAEQKVAPFFMRIHDYFHEHSCFGEHLFKRNYNELWSFIHLEFDKFTGTHDHVKGMPVSRINIKDLLIFSLCT
jgi:hypothetical protein